MEAFDFLPSVIIVAVISTVAWVFRSFIKAWIDSRVHTVSQRDLDQFRAELHEEKANMAAVRDSVLSGRMSRQTIVDQRRFDAIDELWHCVRDFDRLALAPRYLEVIKIDSVFDVIDQEPSLHTFFEFIAKGMPENAEMKRGSNLLDHYIPAEIKGLYLLYAQIVLMCWSIVQAGRMGFDARKFLNLESMNDDVKKHLPYCSEFIETYGKYSWIFLAQTVRDALELQLRSFVDGTQADYDALEKFAIKRQVLPSTADEKLMKVLEQMPENLKSDPPAPNAKDE